MLRNRHEAVNRTAVKIKSSRKHNHTGNLFVRVDGIYVADSSNVHFRDEINQNNGDHISVFDITGRLIHNYDCISEAVYQWNVSFIPNGPLVSTGMLPQRE